MIIVLYTALSNLPLQKAEKYVNLVLIKTGFITIHNYSCTAQGAICIKHASTRIDIVILLLHQSVHLISKLQMIAQLN